MVVDQIKYRVEAKFVRDMIKGDDVNEIRYALPHLKAYLSQTQTLDTEGAQAVCRPYFFKALSYLVVRLCLIL